MSLLKIKCFLVSNIIKDMCYILFRKIIGGIPYTALGAQIPPPLIFRFFLILAPAWGSIPAGP